MKVKQIIENMIRMEVRKQLQESDNTMSIDDIPDFRLTTDLESLNTTYKYHHIDSDYYIDAPGNSIIIFEYDGGKLKVKFGTPPYNTIESDFSPDEIMTVWNNREAIGTHDVEVW